MECRVGLSEQELWLRFAESRDALVRLQLVDQYLPLARMLAARLFKRRGRLHGEFGDYMQSAVLGLLEAVDRFDPARNVPFRYFASRRICGAVLDQLGSMSELHRQTIGQGRLHRRVADLLPAQSGSGDGFQAMVDLALNLSVGFMLQGSGMYSVSEEETDQRSYNHTARRELAHVFATLLNLLPPAQANVVRYHYLCDIDLSEIARMMGVSAGRVSQLHRQALQALRALYQAESRLDLSV
ncbi:sigma-70 family RNA polymerase sigma factor [Noviherbaspirillum sp. 1P10PC]|uniref:sigma-70 family RNA polymerase sigma factor n=1 Tax=Noviherbaspirillum sp. 1P10PC TaxID=3132292 RepID=UPI0039A12A2A